MKRYVEDYDPEIHETFPFTILAPPAEGSVEQEVVIELEEHKQEE